MVQYCSVYDCASSSKTKSKLKFHTIPADMNRRLRWIEHVCKHSGFRDEKLRDYSYICGLHFSKDSYNSMGRLLPSAEPTLFFKPPRRIKDGKKSIPF